MPRQIRILSNTWLAQQSHSRGIESTLGIPGLNDVVAFARMVTGLSLSDGRLEMELFDKDDNSIVSAVNKSINPGSKLEIRPVADGLDGDNGSGAAFIVWDVDVAKFATGRMTLEAVGHFDRTFLQSLGTGAGPSQMVVLLEGGGRFSADIDFVVEDVA